jgi:hypothetical protein
MTTTLYDTDFYAWTQQQATLLRAEAFEEVDWNNLIEEIETLGRSEKNEVQSRLTVLIMHLLKLHYQPTKRTRSWRVTVVTQRTDLERLLRDNPTLRARLPEFVQELYPTAVKRAVVETGLGKTTFPAACPYTLEQVMDEDFWPIAGK